MVLAFSDCLLEADGTECNRIDRGVGLLNR